MDSATTFVAYRTAARTESPESIGNSQPRANGRPRLNAATTSTPQDVVRQLTFRRELRGGPGSAQRVQTFLDQNGAVFLRLDEPALFQILPPRRG